MLGRRNACPEHAPIAQGSSPPDDREAQPRGLRPVPRRVARADGEPVRGHAPGSALTDPYCQSQPESHAAAEEHADARTDAGLTADAPAWLTVLTSGFMHGSFLQLVAGVLFLGCCGPPLERRLGRVRFLSLYLLAGLATTAALIALAPDLPIVTVGATGAVAGVIGALAALAPRSRHTWFELPVGALLGLWLLAQLWLADADAAQPVAGEGGDVAYLAPIGGLAAGLLAAALHARLGDRSRAPTVPAGCRPSRP